MAANVESMFYTRTKPWHGLGVQVQEAPESKDDWLDWTGKFISAKSIRIRE